MKISNAVLSIAGAVVALAIFVTLDINFHMVFRESTHEAIQKDISPLISSGPVRMIITIAIYCIIMIIGGILGKFTGSIIISLIQKTARKD